MKLAVMNKQKSKICWPNTNLDILDPSRHLPMFPQLHIRLHVHQWCYVSSSVSSTQSTLLQLQHTSLPASLWSWNCLIYREYIKIKMVVKIWCLTSTCNKWFKSKQNIYMKRRAKHIYIKRQAKPISKQAYFKVQITS